MDDQMHKWIERVADAWDNWNLYYSSLIQRIPSKRLDSNNLTLRSECIIEKKERKNLNLAVTNTVPGVNNPAGHEYFGAEIMMIPRQWWRSDGGCRILDLSFGRSVGLFKIKGALNGDSLPLAEEL